MSKKVLEVRNLNKYFVSAHSINHAVNNVSFSLAEGEVVGLIGQSGSGKTTVGKALMRTLKETNGSIALDGKIYSNYSKSNKKSMEYIKKVQMIYQNPMDSLNGLRNIYSTLKEALETHHILDDNIKSLLDSQKDMKKTYENDFKLIEAKLDYDYYIEKRKLVNAYIDKFKNAVAEGEIESYLFSETEKLNKDIIAILIKLEEDYANAFNKKYIEFTSNNSKYPEEKALIQARLALKEFNEEIRFVEEFDKIVDKSKKSMELEVAERLEYIEDNVKHFKMTQKTLRKSFKEVSSTQKDIFKHFNYKIEELISAKIEDTLKNIEISLKVSTLSNENLNALNNLMTEIAPKNIKEIISKHISRKNILNNYENTFNIIKEEIDNYVINFSELLIDRSYYREIETEKLNENIALLNTKLKKIKSKDHSHTVKKVLQDAVAEKQKLFNKIKQEFEASSSIQIKELKSKINDMEVGNNELSNIIKVNTKEALVIYNKKNENEIQRMKEKILNAPNSTRKKELFDILKTFKKTKESEVVKYKIKNQAYMIEKKVLSKNIKKQKVLLGLEKTSIFMKKRQYKEVVTTKRIYNILKKVGLKPEHAYRYPHEFSGGQLQRILIARALLVEPKVIIADEPIASLDISIQAQIINLLIDLVKKEGISLIFIGHDLSTIEYLCDKLLVLHLGRVVEKGDSKSIFKKPVHEYTKTLFKSAPKISDANSEFILFENINDYLKEWSQKDKPRYWDVSKDHQIFANEAQWKKWNGKKTTTKKQRVKKK